MHRNIIAIPLTTRHWTAHEFAALHILEHLMIDGRGDMRDYYFDTVGSLWLECMATLRKNAVLFESEVLPGHTRDIKKFVHEMVTLEPNWEYFEYEKQRVIAEVEGRSEFLKATISLYQANFSNQYMHWPGGDLPLIKKVTVADVKNCWQIIQILPKYDMSSLREKYVLDMPKTPKVVSKNPYTFSAVGDKLVMQLSSEYFFDAPRLWQFEQYIRTAWNNDFEIVIEHLPAISVCTLSIPLYTPADAQEIVQIVYIQFLSIATQPPTQPATRFADHFLRADRRQDLLEKFDKQVFESGI